MCCEEGVYSTKVFRVTSPVTMVTMFFILELTDGCHGNGSILPQDDV